VTALEEAMIETCAALGVEAIRRDGHPGCWIAGDARRPPRKIGALGIRIERGVSYHGIALNVDPDLRDFELIDPCGMPGLVSTSIADELGRTAEAPSTTAVEVAGRIFAPAFARALGTHIAWSSRERLEAAGPTAADRRPAAAAADDVALTPVA
jgi:lipoyl(octanoyl) transferase